MSTHDPGESLLHAAKNGSIYQARTLLDKGTDPDTKDASESTPLHYAVRNGYSDVVELLLEYGADPDAKEDSGRTSLHLAAQGGHDVIVQLLLDYSADPDAKDERKSTPLHIAARGKNTLLVKLLCDAGANLDARDDTESTPRFFPTKEDIALLLNGQHVAVSQQAQNAPAFSITINGNLLNHSISPATGSPGTKYILIQSRARFTPSDRQELHDIGVKHLDYVSKNTYLCQYQDGDLEKIRKLEPIVYVDIYRTEFKITPRLRELKEAEPDRDYTVDVIFHEGAGPDSPDVQSDIAKKSDCSLEEIEFLANKARLTTKGLFLDDVASIDVVRCIEDVGEVVAYNNIARQILKIDLRPRTGPIQQQAYQGKGQVIAVADTGLDRGENLPVHHAFGERVRHWFAMHNSTEDRIGHGTHVCGSAVGDGQTATGDPVMGTAPQAELVVQSIWNPNRVKPVLDPPSDLTRLFEDSYNEGARVHSNSWGEEEVEKTSQGKIIKFRQLGYKNAAEQIDKFVYQRDMVICFAAGNNGEWLVENEITGHVGAEAAAKNCITVGASQSFRDSQKPNIDAVAVFSSRGPTTAGRFKPDVVAPGTSILSATSGSVQNPSNLYHNDRAWCLKSGTSMATPLVAGCAATLREALASPFRKSPRILSPTAALIKALLINGADILNPPTPDSPRFVPSKESGFGRVNMANAVGIVRCERGAGFQECELSHNTPKQGKEIEVKVDRTNTTLKATLVWSDPPGDMIKSQLHLTVRDSSKKSKFAIGKNTSQQVVWCNVSPGKVTLNVRVTGKLDKSPQSFAVVWRLY